MKITLKLFALLTDYLPAGANRHSIVLDISPETTVQQVIDQINIPEKMTHLVLLNGIYLDPVHRQNNPLQENDTLAIWPPIAGG
jgi:molybdopterin converting factor small subunit